ncbi:MAG: CDP-glucose 4,6-dehydratase [Brevinema sp.]
MVSANKLRELFQDKIILVTGHTGFKGSWLSYMLYSLGAKIVGYSISEPENKNHSYYALQVSEILLNQTDHLHDIRELQTFERVVDQYKPDFIFHLAAQAIVSTSYKNPYLTMSSNIMGTTNVLETIRLLEREITAVIITSDKCYKNKERLEPYAEYEEMGGDDPYSASKGCAELVFHAYMFSYFQSDPKKRIASTRAGNVFGGGDWSANRLVPDCVRDILTKGVVDIRMPEAVRPWTFVVEILYGYIMLAYTLHQDKKYQGSWNFASGVTKTVLEVCNIFIDALGQGAVNVDKAMSVGKESGLLLIDETKARKELGWDLIFSVDEALKLSAEWYHAQHKGIDMKQYSEEFLNQYFLKTENY